MASCPECGAAIASGIAICPACGADVASARRECPNCGETIAAETDACPACGELFEPAPCARHPNREATGRCVICGESICEKCDRGTRAPYLCETHADIPVIEGWAQIYTTSGEIEAQLIQQNLRADGIEARVYSQKDHALTVDIGDLSPVRILVPAYAYLESVDLVRAHTDSSGEVEFACADCGEPYEPGDTICSACGATLAGTPAG
ncbi:MAG: double zinc ribbon domain-containing protein [Longimicrobiales bacterium]